MRADPRRADEAAAAIALLLGFTLICLAIQWRVGAWQADLGTNGDEAAHFVSAMLVFDYLRHGLPGSPMRFARAYYQHWPRVAIGHWPPLFYPFQALAFAIGGRSVGTAMAVQALVAGGACGWAAWLVRRRLGWCARVAAGAAVLASPLLLFSVDLVLVDTALALWMTASALAWAGFARKPGLGRAILFAAMASGAILTKGNGIALALLPPFHALLTRNLGALRDRRAWVAAALVGLATGPWYVLTYRLAAAGFVYHWGWDYTRPAIPFYLRALLTCLGPFGLIGLLAGLVAIWRGLRDQTMAACGALVLALLMFQMLAPADLTGRYLIPLVPAGMILGAAGLAALWQAAPALRRHAPAGLAVGVLLVADAALLWRTPHVTPYGMDAVVQQIEAARGANRLVLAAGNDHAEGALIAAFAVHDSTQRYYVLRGSQLLAETNFMGSAYRARFTHAAALAAWLRGSGIGWLVMARPSGRPKMRHDRELLHVLTGHDVGARLVYRAQEPRGTVMLYRLDRSAPSPAQTAALLRRAAPGSPPGRPGGLP